MEVSAVIRAVRTRAPVVHAVMSTVSMGFVADGLLAAGARPLMTETEAEAPAMTALADALLVNLGTLSNDGVRGIPVCVRAARSAGHPWVLDPTAVGAAPVRTPLARTLLRCRPAVVRSNASEALALARLGAGGRGADTTHNLDDAREVADQLAREHRTVIAVSGPVDLVTDGDQRHRVHGGSPLMPRVVGTGCLLGALTTACCAVAQPLLAAAAASTWMKRAGELAARHTTRPGSYRVALLDALDEIGETA